MDMCLLRQVLLYFDLIIVNVVMLDSWLSVVTCFHTFNIVRSM